MVLPHVLVLPYLMVLWVAALQLRHGLARPRLKVLLLVKPGLGGAVQHLRRNVGSEGWGTRRALMEVRLQSSGCAPCTPAGWGAAGQLHRHLAACACQPWQLPG